MKGDLGPPEAPGIFNWDIPWDSVLDVPPALPYAEEPQYPLDTDSAVPRSDLKVAETQ
jgi:hypothetical protein